MKRIAVLLSAALIIGAFSFNNNAVNANVAGQPNDSVYCCAKSKKDCKKECKKKCDKDSSTCDKNKRKACRNKCGK